MVTGHSVLSKSIKTYLVLTTQTANEYTAASGTFFAASGREGCDADVAPNIVNSE